MSNCAGNYSSVCKQTEKKTAGYAYSSVRKYDVT